MHILFLVSERVSTFSMRFITEAGRSEGALVIGDQCGLDAMGVFMP